MARDLSDIAESGRGGTRLLLSASVLWLAAASILIATLPLLPIDETRYLTVAWEMRQSGQWLLLTLNGEPYSHKPPLLFWLINAAWTAGGTGIGVARAVPVAVTAGVLAMTYRLGRSLFPASDAIAPLAVLLTLLPAFLLYGAVIMFDQLLTLFVLVCLWALWRAAHSPSLGNWLLLGAGIGAGLLAKGPVLLLHVLPVALLVRVWQPAGAERVTVRSWSLGLSLSVVLGSAIILAWAVPAAITGGPEFARMIFWEQSAGRMVKSFDHGRPFWFYIPILAGFLLPLLFWRPLWRKAREAAGAPLPSPVKFLLIFAVVDIAAFSMISGKQPHYLLPVLPAVALLAAWLTAEAKVERGDVMRLAIPFTVLFAALAVGPQIATTAGLDTTTRLISEGIGNFDPVITLCAGAAAVGAIAVARTIRAQALAMAFAGMALIATVAVQAERHAFAFYDLAPLARALEEHRNKPLAFVHLYQGEVTYLARLTRPVEVVTESQLTSWLGSNPGGVAIWRHKPGQSIAGTKAIFTAPFRGTQQLSLVTLGPTPRN